MKLLIFFIGMLTVTFVGCDKHKENKVILVIFAHPDDETTIGPMMAKYAVKNKVVYIVATDGRYGTRVKKIREDSLIQIRKTECECSGKALGIDTLILLGYHDSFGIKTGVGEYFRQTSNLRTALKEQIEKINPDLIITFGPDGDTGHTDHRIIGAITTEIILREGWIEKYPVYYLGWTKSQAAKFGLGELGYVDEKYFNVQVTFDLEDEDKYFESIRCYKSQNTEKEIENWIQSDKADSTNILYFRKLSVAEGLTREFENP